MGADMGFFVNLLVTVLVNNWLLLLMVLELSLIMFRLSRGDSILFPLIVTLRLGLSESEVFPNCVVQCTACNTGIHTLHEREARPETPWFPRERR